MWFAPHLGLKKKNQTTSVCHLNSVGFVASLISENINILIIR